MQQRHVVGRHLRNAQRQVGHVERAGGAVDQRRTDQEQRRRCQVDGDVVQPGLDPRRPRAVQQQAVGRGQHDLEEDEQVEQVAGEEGAVQPHDLDLEQRLEMRARPCASAPRKRPAPSAPPARPAPASARTADRARARCRRARPSSTAGRRRWRRPRCRAWRAPAAAARAPGWRWRRPGPGWLSVRGGARSAAAARQAASSGSRIGAIISCGDCAAACATDSHHDVTTDPPCRRRGRCRRSRAAPAAPPGTAPSSRSR